MIPILAALEDRIREAVTAEDFSRAKRLVAEYTEASASRLAGTGQAEVLARHKELLEWVRLSAASARAHAAADLALAARASRFQQQPTDVRRSRARA